MDVDTGAQLEVHTLPTDEDDLVDEEDEEVKPSPIAFILGWTALEPVIDDVGNQEHRGRAEGAQHHLLVGFYAALADEDVSD